MILVCPHKLCWTYLPRDVPSGLLSEKISEDSYHPGCQQPPPLVAVIFLALVLFSMGKSESISAQDMLDLVRGKREMDTPYVLLTSHHTASHTRREGLVPCHGQTGGCHSESGALTLARAVLGFRLLHMPDRVEI